MKLVTVLDPQIKAVCPIDGVSIGREDNKATWRIDYAPEATAQQRTDAQAVVDAFDIETHVANMDAAAEIAAAESGLGIPRWGRDLILHDAQANPTLLAEVQAVEAAVALTRERLAQRE